MTRKKMLIAMVPVIAITALMSVVASAGGKPDIPLRDGATAVEVAPGRWEVEGAPATDRELREIENRAKGLNRAAAVTDLNSIIAEISADPATNPAIRRLEQAVQALHAYLELEE